jgi:plasmid maintenance system antidote protein VapI
MMARKKATRRRRKQHRPETRLARWLESVGMTRVELAQRLEVFYGHVDKMCHGERRPSLELALRIEKLTRGAVPMSYWATLPGSGSH